LRLKRFPTAIKLCNVADIGIGGTGLKRG